MIKCFCKSKPAAQNIFFLRLERFDMKEESIAFQIAFLAIQVGVILFAARVTGNFFRKLRLPSVLGELLSGVIIGPYVLGSISWGVKNLSAIVGVAPEGIEYPGAVETVSVIVLTLCPPEVHQPYLEFVSGMAAVLSQKSRIDRIKKSVSKEEVYDVLVR